MTTAVTIITTILVLICFYIVKKSIYQDISKWQEVYFFIIKHINDGTDDEEIKTKLVDRYGLTPLQAENALLAARDADIGWFEQATWK